MAAVSTAPSGSLKPSSLFPLGFHRLAAGKQPGDTLGGEHRVPREQGRIYARDYQGAGPAFVLMRGFADNLHIWDDVIPYLVPSGRRGTWVRPAVFWREQASACTLVVEAGQ
jgi:hypothetical protein